MSSDLNETSTRTSVEQFLAGLSVWGALLVVFALV